MIITAVEARPKRRGRVDVYVDGVVAFDMRAGHRHRARDSARAHHRRGADRGDRAADRRRAALETAAAMLARRARAASAKCAAG